MRQKKVKKNRSASAPDINKKPPAGKISRKISKEKPSVSLLKLRAEIDAIDRLILKSVNERARLAFEIAEAKRKISKNIYDPEREKQVREKILALNPGPLTGGGAVSIFTEIIKSCRKIQSAGRASYLGPEGSFSHQAAAAVFGRRAELVPLKSFEQVFESVLQGSVSKGIVPIENSTEGSVASMLELIAENEIRITGEHFEKVSHCLISKTGKVSGIKKIASHPQALGQCAKWISKNLPRAQVVETSSTAGAALLAASEKSVAAVAGAHCAFIYGLRAAAEKIEDNPLNSTRFVVVENSAQLVEKPDGGNKVSIAFSIKDRPGALHKTLFAPLASAGVNLTRIESRPSGRAWEYMFFVDFEGSTGTRKTDGLLKKIESRSLWLKVLGCYFSGEKSGGQSALSRKNP